jgi:hypothetical protein
MIRFATRMSYAPSRDQGSLRMLAVGVTPDHEFAAHHQKEQLEGADFTSLGMGMLRSAKRMPYATSRDQGSLRMPIAGVTLDHEFAAHH